MTEILKKSVNFIDLLSDFDKRHPYIISFVLSLIITSVILFWNAPAITFVEDPRSSDSIEFINIQSLAEPEREVKKEVSSDTGEVASSKPVQRAKGTTSNPVDLAFVNNVDPPRIIGRIPDFYPIEAEEAGVEADVFTEILMNEAGQVKRVDVIRVRLKKNVPPDVEQKLQTAFIRNTKKMLFSVKFTPAIINGKKQAVIFEYPVRFKLE
jgi:hypothetical protein